MGVRLNAQLGKRLTAIAPAIAETDMELRSQTAGRAVMQAEARPAFEEGTALIFSQWTALELAVENEWGGRSSRQKADGLIAEALDWFYGKKGGILPLPGHSPTSDILPADAHV